ncbi:MAG: two-component system, sporulation sensor kinase [Acidobacteriota bacterium]|jgi:nitrogen-specific signal transduction histidine kinase|nr:two-component system, sporulation sensor kinase [Acidobacteriota bacterium]
MPERKREDGEVVYRRISPGVDETGSPDGRRDGERKSPVTPPLGPTLKTIIVGFVLLLALVILLGYLSVRKADEVGTKILDDERRYAAIRDFTFELRNASTRLDNEARARGRKLGTETEETRPIFEVPLRRARTDIKELLRRLEKPPYSENEKWRSLYVRLITFVQATEDPDAYLREGYAKFRDADKELDSLLEETRREQEGIFYRSEELQKGAARRIYLLTAIALLMGTLVAAYTIREARRRLRQVRESMDETRREREFSTQMLEGMVSAIAAIDAQDRIRSANAAFFKIFPEASVGASIHDKFSSPDAMKMLEAAISTRVEHSTYRGRWVCDEDTPNCSNRSFDVYSSPLVIDGEKGQIVTLVDVTEAAEAESVMRRTESLTAMGQAVAQVAHEIKNPLGSIRLGVSMLRDTSPGEESQSTIDLVERGIHHLNKLVMDVTQFSRQRPLELAEVELHALIDSSLELISDLIQEKSTPIEKHFTSEPLRGDWDADQLRQVMVNLFANGVDASKENSPLIISTARVTAEQSKAAEGNGNRGTATPKAFARLTITDRGDGMDERTQSRIFEPFFTTKKRGTGLGLAIVKQIVEQHGGAISVESMPGEGTSFIVDLPIKQ